MRSAAHQHRTNEKERGRTTHPERAAAVPVGRERRGAGGGGGAPSEDGEEDDEEPMSEGELLELVERHDGWRRELEAIRKAFTMTGEEALDVEP